MARLYIAPRRAMARLYIAPRRAMALKLTPMGTEEPLQVAPVPSRKRKSYKSCLNCS
ncbi:MAG: hypothetical protein RIM23_00615 [Coleofasciculus sp. G3-WIS-01]|uniref:hypothetical protein n=1 Tax=Coleofasciculus sp. G3-WIS-01 TaxID=3069528 RepID=UPI0032F3DFAD